MKPSNLKEKTYHFSNKSFNTVSVVICLGILTAQAAFISGCTKKNEESQPATESLPTASVSQGETSLKIEELKVGTGTEATSSKRVTVHYTGWLTNGTKFDSSVDRGTPFKFNLGAGQVIRGWEEGVQGMKVGGKRKLTIPPDMAYGERGAGGAIPPNATLVFEVELLNVE